MLGAAAADPAAEENVAEEPVAEEPVEPVAPAEGSQEEAMVVETIDAFAADAKFVEHLREETVLEIERATPLTLAMTELYRVVLAKGDVNRYGDDVPVEKAHAILRQLKQLVRATDDDELRKTLGVLSSTLLQMIHGVQPQAVHAGVTCDKSNACPIIGTRYHLANKNYDLCQKEWDKLSSKDQARYEKITWPRGTGPPSPAFFNRISFAVHVPLTGVAEEAASRVRTLVRELLADLEWRKRLMLEVHGVDYEDVKDDGEAASVDDASPASAESFLDFLADE